MLSWLCCAVLCWVVQYCAGLCGAVLDREVLCWVVQCCTMLCCVVRCGAALGCKVLCWVVQCCAVLCWFVWCGAVLRCVVLRSAVLGCAELCWAERCCASAPSAEMPPAGALGPGCPVWGGREQTTPTSSHLCQKGKVLNPPYCSRPGFQSLRRSWSRGRAALPHCCLTCSLFPGCRGPDWPVPLLLLTPGLEVAACCTSYPCPTALMGPFPFAEKYR